MGELQAGIDEVGWGAAAGPLVVAAAILPVGCVQGVRDSKQVSSEGERMKLVEEMGFFVKFHHVATIDVDELNANGMARAWTKAVSDCIIKLRMSGWNEAIVLDGDRLPKIAPTLLHRVEAKIKADQTVYAVSAASIIAKVYRDQMMHVWADKFPQYDFHNNKGYLTPLHRIALRRHGLTPIHRLKYVKRYIK